MEKYTKFIPKFSIGDIISYKGFRYEIVDIITGEKFYAYSVRCIESAFVVENYTIVTTIEMKDENNMELVKNAKEQEEWIPQEGDIFRKKGIEKPLYQLCSKVGYSCFSFVQIMENGIAGGEIYVSTLVSEYELVKRPKNMQKTFEELLEPLLEPLRNYFQNKKELEDFIRNVNIQEEADKFKKEILLKEANGFNSILVSYGSDCYRLGMQNIIEQCKKYLTNG
jgi:hypothetical protein